MLSKSKLLYSFGFYIKIITFVKISKLLKESIIKPFWKESLTPTLSKKRRKRNAIVEHYRNPLYTYIHMHLGS